MDVFRRAVLLPSPETFGIKRCLNVFGRTSRNFLLRTHFAGKGEQGKWEGKGRRQKEIKLTRGRKGENKKRRMERE